MHLNRGNNLTTSNTDAGRDTRFPAHEIWYRKTSVLNFSTRPRKMSNLMKRHEPNFTFHRCERGASAALVGLAGLPENQGWQATLRPLPAMG
jgi:hypothetical protein